jgi:hypothetical protein
VNAAPWLHLIAGTLLVVAIAPRLLLALVNGGLERYRAAHLAPALDEPYYRRLLRGLHDAPAPVIVIPYSFTPEASAQANLEALLVRALGGNATVSVAAPVAYGAEDTFVHAMSPGDHVVGLFNLAATPEDETHGAFLAGLARQGPGAETPLVVLDEAAWRMRNGDDPERLEARRKLWRTLCADHRCAPLFVDLAAPDFAAAERALDAALAEHAR